MKNLYVIICVSTLLILASCSREASTTGTFTVEGTTYQVVEIRAGALKVQATAHDNSASWMSINFPGVLTGDMTKLLPQSGKVYPVGSTRYRSNYPLDSIASISVQISPSGPGPDIYYESIDSIADGAHNKPNGTVNATVVNGNIKVIGHDITMKRNNGSLVPMDFVYSGPYSW